MVKLRMVFEKGGELTATLNQEGAPKSVKAVLDALPIKSYVAHTRWCGREFSLGFSSADPPPKEAHTGMASKFDVFYWRNWDGEALAEAQATEAISIYYGPEKMEYHGGRLTANLIGHIDYDQEKQLEEIGLRIWQKGFENVVVTLA